jgi:hypothetical protein
MSVSSLSIPLLIWGGSPKRILKKPDGLSADEIEKIVDYDRFLCSSSPDLMKMQETGELSWIDIPGNASTKRYFILSNLIGDPGSRPLWFFFCLFIERENWERIESHRRLLKALEEACSSSLFDLLMGAGSEIKLTLPDESFRNLSRLDFPLPKILRMNQEDALSQIEKHFSIMEGKNFFQSRLAWNPANLSGEWTYVVQTRDRKIPMLQEKSIKLKDSPEEFAPPCKKESRRGEKRNESNWGKMFFLVFLIAIVGFSFLLWKTREPTDPPLPNDVKESQMPSRVP